MTTIYLKTNWYYICILQFSELVKVSNMETILCDQKLMADLHTMHVVKGLETNPNMSRIIKSQIV